MEMINLPTEMQRVEQQAFARRLQALVALFLLLLFCSFCLHYQSNIGKVLTASNDNERGRNLVKDGRDNSTVHLFAGQNVVFVPTH